VENAVAVRCLNSITHFKRSRSISNCKSIFEKILSPFENQKDMILSEADSVKIKVYRACFLSSIAELIRFSFGNPV